MKTNRNFLIAVFVGCLSINAVKAQTVGYIPKYITTSSWGNSLVFDNGTNVGVGTASPGVKLDVLGAMRATGSSADLYLTSTGTGAGTWRILGSTNALKLFRIYDNDNAVDRFNIDASGKVGIGTGTTAPLIKLDVRGSNAKATTTAFENIIEAGSTDASSPLVLRMGIKTDATAANRYGAIEVDDAGTKRNLVLGASGGNVGIGTTSPDICNNGTAFKTLSILGPNTSGYSCGVLELASQLTDAATNITGIVNFTANANASTKKSIAQVVAWTQGTASTNRGGALTFTTKPDGIAYTIERMRITSAGDVGIGTDLTNNPNNYKLAVNGTIGAKAVKVEITSTTWPDFVFNDEYKLKNIKEVELYIKQNGHLPEIPTAKEIEASGADLGELLKLQMQKIEELTLYIIEQNKRIETLECK